MKKLLLLAVVALLFSAVVSCEKDNITMSGPYDKEEMISTRANAIVPFKGTYTTYPEFVSIDENGTQTFRIPSQGKATHLGKSTWYSDSQVHDTFLPPPWDQTGTSIFTAADGSMLIGTFTGTTAPTETSPFAGRGTYVIDYGTGRFVGAAGSGTYSYVVAPDFSSAQLKFTGTLENP